jgi:hypothetical protein
MSAGWRVRRTRSGGITSASGERPQETAGDGALRPVALPDVSVAEPVQRQLRERFGSLTQKLRNSSTPQAELAEAYGDLGRLLLAARLGSAAGAARAGAGAARPALAYHLGHVTLLVGDRAQAINAFEQPHLRHRISPRWSGWARRTWMMDAPATPSRCF